MKAQNKESDLTSRRKFVRIAAAVAATFTIVPLSSVCSGVSSYLTGERVPNSKFGGVQVGAITFSYRDVRGGIEDILRACVESGVSSVELMSRGIEEWCGAPLVVKAPEQQQAHTVKEYDDLKRQAAESQEALHKWRLSPPLEKFEELAQKFKDAGVNIHLVKWSPKNWSDEEIDYAFITAKAMGATGVVDELGDEACKRLGPFAEKHGMYAVFHNHTQFGDPTFDVDTLLKYSPAIMLNWDVGHYYGTTCNEPSRLSPFDFLTKYHDRILSIHLKDSTCPLTTHQVWGQGQTPLAEILLLVKKNKWPVYCDIEMVYPIPEWSNSVKEVRTCVNYCRAVLI